VLAPYRKLKRTIALDAMWRTRKDAGLPIPRTFDSSVQAVLQYYCEESKMSSNGAVASLEKHYSAGPTVLALASGPSCAKPPVLGFRQIAPRYLAAL
jgi:hypothetical protein